MSSRHPATVKVAGPVDDAGWNYDLNTLQFIRAKDVIEIFQAFFAALFDQFCGIAVRKYRNSL